MSACDDIRTAFLASDPRYQVIDPQTGAHATIVGLRALVDAHPECATCQDKANVFYFDHPELQSPMVYEGARIGPYDGPRDPLSGFTAAGHAAFLARYPECAAWAVAPPPPPPPTRVPPAPGTQPIPGTAPTARTTPWFVWAALGIGGGLLALEAWRTLQARGR